MRAGIIKTKVPLKGPEAAGKAGKESTAPKTKAQQRYSRLTGDTNRPNGRVERVQRTAKMECNLLGLTVDEALSEVDSFIDRAILNGQTVVYLIHGNGTGALRTAIHKHLRGNRMVKRLPSWPLRRRRKRRDGCRTEITPKDCLLKIGSLFWLQCRENGEYTRIINVKSNRK